MHELFFPLPMTYAVIQLDVEGTLRDLAPDAQALDEARALRPLKRLVYLHTVLELPFPQNADYKYDIYLVGPGLRPANDAECIPQDMCVPIFPTESDTSQPTNRAPLRPTPSFPFSGCYHWLGKDTELEVRVKRGIYDPKDGEVHVTLSGVQHVYMEDCYDEDSDRLFAVREAMTESSVSRESSSVDSEEQDYYYYVHDAPGSRPQADRGYSHSQFDENMDDRSSLQRSGTVVSEAFSDDHSSNELGVSFGAGDLDVFGIDSARAPERAAIPLVDCWLDISAHMTQDEIPDPFAFLVECRALSEIVRRLLMRQALESRDMNEHAGKAPTTTFEKMIAIPIALSRAIRSLFCFRTC